MPADDRHEELLRLIADLTARVHRLERLANISADKTEVAPEVDAAPVSIRPSGPAAARTTEYAGGELESRIGGRWLNRVGILAVLIGVSYFLKYAFDNAWVGPAGRVVTGLVAGTAVVLFSEYVRRRGYGAFSYSLTAVGIGVLYLSLWASSQLYGLVPPGMAFAGMASVTAATVGLALWQNAEVIAAFAVIGGFLTPVLLSTGRNNLAGLFTYVTLLDVGALAVSRYRPWIRVAIGSYIGSVILYWAWHGRYYTPDQFAGAFVSISAVFVVFAMAPFLHRDRRDVNGVLFLALANAAAYFYELWELFDHSGESLAAAGAAILFGGLFFLMAIQLRSRAPVVITEVHWTIGAALLIVAVPLGLDSPWLTIGWFVEGAALFGVSYRTGNRYLRHLGAVALALGTARMLAIDDFDVTRLILNERFATSAVAVASLIYVARTVAAAAREDERVALVILAIGINVLALVSLNREITDAFEGIVQDFAYSALWMTYGAGLMFAGFYRKSRFLRWQALVLIGVTVCKVFLYDTSSLDRGYRILSLIALGVILLVTSFLYQKDWFKLEER